MKLLLVLVFVFSCNNAKGAETAYQHGTYNNELRELRAFVADHVNALELRLNQQE
jgi:hypothetical protein